jgi:hypothetical protein
MGSSPASGRSVAAQYRPSQGQPNEFNLPAAEEILDPDL